MGIDYVIGLTCSPKELLGVAGIVRSLKAEARARHVVALLRAEGDTRAPHEMTFVSAVLRPDGEMEEHEVTVGSLLAQARLLEAHAPACVGCPANVAGEAYGCVGYVGYPIERDTERWLLGRLPESGDCTAGWLLERAVADMGWSGAGAARMREAGDTFFESDTALVLRWETEEETFSLSSDQVFEMLFGLGNLRPSHLGLLALFFGVLPHDLPPEALAPALRHGPTFEAALELGSLEVDGQSPQIRQLAQLFRAICRAVALDTELGIDA